MKWLTKAEITRRAKKSYKEALLVSIEHHIQIAQATRKEFFAAVGLGQVSISADHCGICQRMDTCRDCFLRDCFFDVGCGNGCGGNWQEIRKAIDEILIGCSNDYRKPSWLAVVKAEKKMVKRLKRELKKRIKKDLRYEFSALLTEEFCRGS